MIGSVLGNTTMVLTRFQIRLSTLLALMILASAFLAANTLERSVSDKEIRWRVRGWPWEIERRFDSFTEHPFPENGSVQWPSSVDIFSLRRDAIISYKWLKLTGNIVLSIVSCIAVAIVLERHIYRRLHSLGTEE